MGGCRIDWGFVVDFAGVDGVLSGKFVIAPVETGFSARSPSDRPVSTQNCHSTLTSHSGNEFINHFP
jgi:hypothetical protein